MAGHTRNSKYRYDRIMTRGKRTYDQSYTCTMCLIPSRQTWPCSSTTCFMLSSLTSWPASLLLLLIVLTNWSMLLVTYRVTGYNNMCVFEFLFYLMNMIFFFQNHVCLAYVQFVKNTILLLSVLCALSAKKGIVLVFLLVSFIFIYHDFYL